MSTFPNSPRLIKGGIVLIDPQTSVVQRVIALQYNPDTLTRSFQIKLDAEIDATDQLEFPDQNPNATQFGIQPQLAALETIIYPTSAQIQENNRLASSGTLEIVPMEAPLTLFVWSKNRVLPVRVTEFSITEEAFDPSLNPLRAKVSLGMRVLSVNDLPFDHKGSSLFLAYQQQKENLARKAGGVNLNPLGLTRIP